MALSERFIFLAGGIAAEVKQYGAFDQVGCLTDQKMMQQMGGKRLDDYLDAALAVLQARDKLLKLIVNALDARWIPARAEASFNEDPDTYDLLCKLELDRLWFQSG